MKIFIYTFFLYSFIISTELDFIIESKNDDLKSFSEIERLYQTANELRIKKDLEQSLQILFQIDCCYVQANYDIAEIFLNEYNNFNIALDYFNRIINSLSNKPISEMNLNNKKIYKKSLFMSGYIYSNYLGLYSKGNRVYETFISQFPDDELIESVKYEMSLLEPKEKINRDLLNRR